MQNSQGKNYYILIAGPILFFILLFLRPSDVDSTSWHVLAVAGWMLLWWLTETVNLAVTALLPLVLFPVLGIMPISEVSANYGNPMVYLFFGGFIIALAIEKWNLHRRIALNIILKFGTSTPMLLLGFMAATAFLSMWISNTATTVMMLPIALSVIAISDTEQTFKSSALLLLSIAWAANIGGVATLIGTPPNLVLSGFVKEEFGTEIYFSQWIIIGFPVALLMLLAAFFILKQFLPKGEDLTASGARENIREELKQLGKIRGPEKRVFYVFVGTALAWICREFIVDLTGLTQISDTVIAIVSAIVLFTLPSDKSHGERILVWDDTKYLSWGILILFGGGLALAAGIQKTIWVQQIGSIIGSGSIENLFVLIVILATVSIFLTELISNLALVSALLPLVAAATSTHEQFMLLSLPVTIGASCAFMLPMATPPNAIVFSSRRLSIDYMARYGFILNLASVAIVSLAVYFLA